MNDLELKKRILDTAEDAALDFLAYDRKSDEELTVNVLEQAILSGEVTMDELVEAFRRGLKDNWPRDL